MLQINILLH